MTNRLLTRFIFLLLGLSVFHPYAFGKDGQAQWTSVESALQMLNGKGDLILIDVRNNSEFERFRIPTSINIPLFTLKTKTFLKSRPLVLINEGHTYKQLLQECAALSDSAFTVSVLDGGLYQWKQKGGPLEGDVFAQRELKRILPQTLFQGKGYENWILIDVSQSGKSGIKDQDLKGVHIPYAVNPERFISELNAEIAKQKDLRFLSIIIYDEDGKTYERMEKQIEGAGIINVLYLKGGFEGYRSFERQQFSIAQEKTDASTRKPVRTYRNCAGCP